MPALPPPATTTPTSPKPPISVLFVCLGNICRSPMAEAVFRHLTLTNPRLSPQISTLDSAGTGAYHELDPPDSRTLSTLRKHKMDQDYEHAARKIMDEDFRAFDYILAMDRWNLKDLQKMQRRVLAKEKKDEEEGRGRAEKAKANVMMFGAFGGERNEEVVDPYYGADDGFEAVWRQCVRFGVGFIKEVLQGDIE